MGMYDSVMAFCPFCGEPIQFQSKVAECLLREYPLDAVPIDIATDIVGEVVSCSCGRTLRIEIVPRDTVPMGLTVVVD